MNSKMNRWMKEESGITALETAIILIAFVVVAAIFAFSVLTTGTFLTERSKEAAYAGLQEVRGSMELKGSVVLSATGSNVVFNLSTVAGGSSIDLSKVMVTYRDSAKNQEVAMTTNVSCATVSAPAVAYTWNVERPDGTALANCILKAGDLAKITVALNTGILTTNSITQNKVFALELKPPTGGVILIERTAPAQIDVVTDLH